MPYVVIIEDEPVLAALLAHHILSAISSLDDRIRLLAEHGVDDFILKPCGVGEVMARSRAVLRRTGRVRDLGAGRDS